MNPQEIDAVGRTRWASADPQYSFPVHNPATGKLLAVVPGCGPDEVNRAVEAAGAAQKTWKARSCSERAQWLSKIAAHLRGHVEELALLETLENGKPLAQARNDVTICIAAFELFASVIAEHRSTVREIGPVTCEIVLEPFGVVGAVVPFNWPPIHFAAKTAPALAAGNAVVIKPAEQAPLTVTRLAELASEILPDDIVHVVPGPGATGGALVAHKKVRKVSFTGAPTTGRAVLRTIADNLTPALMELGGKNPFIVFPDADMDRAARDIVEGAYFNKGEACTAASRLLVHSDVYDSFIERVARAVRRLRTGDGLNPETDVGPLVTAAQQERVRSYLKIAVEEGAKIFAQGALPEPEDLQGGFYIPPTLITEVTPHMRIAQEEIFGPVTCAIRFQTLEEAIEIANGTEFALVAGIYSTNTDILARAARGIEAGIVFVNNYWRAIVGTPFGGTKSSGFGREHAPETLREFGYLKTIRTPNGKGPVPHWPLSGEADLH